MNPELRKNIWLELTPNRLLTMPFILFLIFTLSYLGSSSDQAIALKSIHTTATILFFIISVVWGSKLAAESITDEVNQNTWDFQRMSSMDAWAMTWGKLIGSTLFSWYGGLICFAFSILTAIALDGQFIFESAFFMLLSCIIAHTISFLVSMRGVIKRNGVGRVFSGGGIIGGLAIGGFVNSLMSQENLIKMQFSTTEWYGLEIGNFIFLAVSILVFQSWFLMGSYRLMRYELQFQSTPTVWVAFLLFQMFYFGGFLFNKSISSLRNSIGGALTVAMFIGILWTYALLSSEVKSAVVFRKIFRFYKLKDWKRLYINTPRWMLTYLVTVIVGFAALFFVPEATLISTREIQPLPIAFILATLLFLLRDVAIILYFSLFKNSSKGDKGALITFFVLYILLPGIFSLLFGRGVLPLFYPISDSTSAIFIVVAPIIHVVLALHLLKLKWQKSLSEIEAAA